MSYDIAVENGATIKLPTGGTYCDRDIIIKVAAIPSSYVQLPELTNPAAASDLALDKQLIDADGNVVTGSLGEAAEGVLINSTGGDDTTMVGEAGDVSFSVVGVYSKSNSGDNTMGAIVRPGARFAVRNVPTSLFGDATADQVAKGATFTSAAGLLVEGTHECEGGVTLPELSDPGTASDMASGKELIDQDGNVLTGTLKDGGGLELVGGTPSMYLYMNPNGTSSRGIKTTANADTDMIVRAGDEVRVITAYAEFGDAAKEDVRAGKTFTSVTGLKVTGTMEDAGMQLPEGAIVVQIVKGEQASTQVGSGYSLSVSYADAVEINDSIALAFVGTAQTLSNISATTDFSQLMGKYVRAGSSYGTTGGTFYYIPDDATFTVGGQSMSKTLTCDKAQLVSLQKVII